MIMVMKIVFATEGLPSALLTYVYLEMIRNPFMYDVSFSKEHLMENR